MTINQDEDGTVGIVLCDRDGAPRASFTLASDGQPRLRLADGEGRVVFEAPEGGEFEYGTVTAEKSSRRRSSR